MEFLQRLSFVSKFWETYIVHMLTWLQFYIRTIYAAKGFDVSLEEI